MNKVELVKVTNEDDSIRLDRWFKRHHPDVSHGAVEKALRKGQIKVNSKKAKSNDRVSEGDEIRVPPLVVRDPNEFKEFAKEKAIPQKYIDMINESVIFKNDDIIVINKPAGLATQGGKNIDVSVDSLLDFLKFGNEMRPKLVHRLDKDTSGILLLARNTKIASKMGDKFRSRNMEKTYWALVIGCPNETEGKISLPILKRGAGAGKEKMVVDMKDGQRAVTFFKIMDNMAGRMSWLELKPETGRTHQLRVHMEAIGHPILGDGKYGGKEAFINGFSKKMHLHARHIRYMDDKGKIQEFTAEIKGNMAESFKLLELEE